MTVKQKDEIIDILENLPYWDTCPQDYKDKIPALVKALSKVNNSVLDDVSISEAKVCHHCGSKAIINFGIAKKCSDCRKMI